MHEGTDEENIQTIVERLGEYEKILESVIAESEKGKGRAKLKSVTFRNILEQLRSLQGKIYSDLSDHDKLVLIQIDKYIERLSPKQYSEIQSKKIQKSEQKSQAGGVTVPPGATTVSKGAGSSMELGSYDVDGSSRPEEEYADSGYGLEEKEDFTGAAAEEEKYEGSDFELEEKSPDFMGGAEERKASQWHSSRKNRLVNFLNPFTVGYRQGNTGKDVQRAFDELKNKVGLYSEAYYDGKSIAPGGLLGDELIKRKHDSEICALVEYTPDGGGIVEAVVDDGTGEFTQETVNYLRKIGYTGEKGGSQACLLDPGETMQARDFQVVTSYYDGVKTILDTFRKKGFYKFDFLLGQRHYVAGALINHGGRYHLIMPDSMNSAVMDDSVNDIAESASRQMATLLDVLSSKHTAREKKDAVENIKKTGILEAVVPGASDALSELKEKIGEKGTEAIQHEIVGALAEKVSQLEKISTEENQTAAVQAKKLLLDFFELESPIIAANLGDNTAALSAAVNTRDEPKTRELIEENAKIIRAQDGERAAKLELQKEMYAGLKNLEIHESYDCLQNTKYRGLESSPLQLDSVNCGPWATKILKQMTRDRCAQIAGCTDKSAMNRLIQTVANIELGADGTCNWTKGMSERRANELRIEQYGEIEVFVESRIEDVMKVRAEFSSNKSDPGHRA